MAVEPHIYCLENVTDYTAFERLCTDVMALSGYPAIEPIGGVKDKGRDAINRSASGAPTIFAYSVREDWRKKLESDAASIKNNGHHCSRVVFLCTATFTPNERDDAVDFIKKTFAWDLELYGIERLSSMLRTTCASVVAKHPQIFAPPFFPAAGGLSLALALDHVIIDHVEDDAPLAQWLSRRLTLEGYSVWCRGLAPLAGVSVGETVRGLIRQRGFRVISILSPAALRDADFNSRRVAAHETGRVRGSSIVIPAFAKPSDVQALDSDTRQLTPAVFKTSWASGLTSVLQSLAAAGCPRGARAPELAASSYLPESLVVTETETLYSNMFRVRRLPEKLLITELDADVPEDCRDLDFPWGYRKIAAKRVISISPAPRGVRQKIGVSLVTEVEWKGKQTVEGVETNDLIKHLVRGTITAAFVDKGLCYCREAREIYFPSKKFTGDSITATNVDGTATWFAVAGDRTFRGQLFNYHLVPMINVRGSHVYGFDVLMRIRLRLTEPNGARLAGTKVNSRRKSLCKTWWNDKWSIRVLGMMQFLADGNDAFTLGEGPNDIVINTWPRAWIAPARLKEEAIDAATAELQEEIADEEHDDDEEEDAGTPAAENDDEAAGGTSGSSAAG